MKECELCSSPARMYCESDQANLCWACDEKVHCANFLVARHSRRLLCHICQSPTPWTASGFKLGDTVSVCDACTKSSEGKRVTSLRREEDSHALSGEDDEDLPDDDAVGDDYDDGGGGDDDDDDDEEEEEEEEEDDEDDDEEVEENQVVPWSSSTPPPVASSSSSEDESSMGLFTGGRSDPALKHVSENADPYSDDEICCSSNRNRAPSVLIPPFASNEDEASSHGFVRPSKRRKTTEFTQFDIDQDQAKQSLHQGHS